MVPAGSWPRLSAHSGDRVNESIGGGFRHLGTLAVSTSFRSIAREGSGGGPQIGKIQVTLGETHFADNWLGVHGLLNGAGQMARSGSIASRLVKAGQFLRESRGTGNLLSVLAVDAGRGQTIC